MDPSVPAPVAPHYPTASVNGLPGNSPLRTEQSRARGAGLADTADLLQDAALQEVASGSFTADSLAAGTPSILFARETGGQFVLGQNYPNPYTDETTVPFTLANSSDVRLDLFDPLGRKVAVVLRKGLDPGPQHIHLNLYGLDLPAGDYFYQLQVTSRYGTYRQRRTMTAAH